MAHTYTPSPVDLVDLTLPDDGDTNVVASVNDPLEALADAVINLQAATAYSLTTYTADNAAIVAPANAIAALLIAYGGGAGGGGGADGTTTTFYNNAGGGGGGGARKHTALVTIIAGDTYAVDIGAGGAGGARGVGGSPGSNGADTTFSRVTAGPTILATFRGGEAGEGGLHPNTALQYAICAVAGGKSIRPAAYSLKALFNDDGGTSNWQTAAGAYSHPPMFLDVESQQGGSGTSSNNDVRPAYGGSSPEGYYGGATGAHGTTLGSHRGGGGGGGGGAGPGGLGVDGGTGGNGNNAGNGTAGATPSAPSANTGCGGGGGGGGGNASGTPGNAGAGSAGSSGKLTIVWILGA